MIDLSGLALKLSLPFIGIMNNFFNPPSLITGHVPTRVSSPSHLSINNNCSRFAMS